MTRFARAVLAWYDREGRHGLPWTSDDPYRVWVSEIMLQQTQVETVKPFFGRFMARFPTVSALAAADIGEVLAEWAGLGYYARARNLHAAAGLILTQHGARLPLDVDALQTLPGIGRSTAGAIVALAAGLPAPILDANVRRVLARFHALALPAGTSALTHLLWEQAQRHLPSTRLRDYTQGLMDLGALVCTPRPRCPDCPLGPECAGRNTPSAYPGPRREPRAVPTIEMRLLILRNAAGEVLLERRPPVGLWGGLWSLPECGPDTEAWCEQHLGLGVTPQAPRAPVRHRLTHRELVITPQPALLRAARALMEHAPLIWYKLPTGDERPRSGMAAPVRKLLLDEQQHQGISNYGADR